MKGKFIPFDAKKEEYPKFVPIIPSSSIPRNKISISENFIPWSTIQRTKAISEKLKGLK